MRHVFTERALIALYAVIVFLSAYLSQVRLGGVLKWLNVESRLQCGNAAP